MRVPYADVAVISPGARIGNRGPRRALCAATTKRRCAPRTDPVDARDAGGQDSVAMPRAHNVEQGDCLASIAKHYGFLSWRTIYHDAANADLRTRRPDPFALSPGDVVAIPDPLPRTEPCATRQRHRFKAETAPTVLRLKLKAGSGDAFAGKTYELIAGGETWRDTTKAEGLIEHPVPGGTTTALLKVWLHGEPPDCDPVTFSLAIGHLDPIDTVSGIQGRLFNLGLYRGAASGELDAATTDAIAAFQVSYELEVTGELDDATRDRLRKVAKGT